MMRPVSDQVVCMFSCCFSWYKMDYFLSYSISAGLCLELLAVCVHARKCDAFLPKQIIIFSRCSTVGKPPLAFCRDEIMSVTIGNGWIVLYFLKLICVCKYGCMHERVHMWRSEDRFWESVLSLGSRDQIQTFRVVSQPAQFKLSQQPCEYCDFDKTLGFFSKFILFVLGFNLNIKWFWLKELKSESRFLGIMSSTY